MAKNKTNAFYGDYRQPHMQHWISLGSLTHSEEFGFGSHPTEASTQVIGVRIGPLGNFGIQKEKPRPMADRGFRDRNRRVSCADLADQPARENIDPTRTARM